MRITNFFTQYTLLSIQSGIIPNFCNFQLIFYYLHIYFEVKEDKDTCKYNGENHSTKETKDFIIQIRSKESMNFKQVTVYMIMIPQFL
jgi:hypothetical protein